MADIVTFADKVDNAATTTATASIPANEKIPAADFNQLKAGVNLNHADILVLQTGKVDVVSGKVLSDNNFTTAQKNKVDFLTVTANTNLDTISTNVIASKTKTDFLTVTGAINLDTIKTKTDIAITSNVTGVTGADVVTNIVSLTQAEYDAIVSKNATTFYIIVG